MLHPRVVAFLAVCSLAALVGCEPETLPATPVPAQATVPRPPLLSPVASPSPLVSPVPPAASPSPRAQTYTVQEGDTLSAIASRVYGDANLWNLIFQANRQVVTSADELRVGMTLRIPPTPTAAPAPSPTRS